MPGYHRSRYRESQWNPGQRWWNNQAQPTGRYDWWESSDDVVGNLDAANDFVVERYDRVGSVYDSNDGTWHVPLTIDFGSWHPSPTAVSYRNKLLARGPNKPKIYLPVALFELRDLPRMIKHAGDLLHKIASNPRGLDPIYEAAAATLAYQFGWRPLMQDIATMLDAAKIIDDEQKRLRGVRSEKGLRVKVTLDNQHTPVSKGDKTLSSVYLRSLNQKWTGFKTYEAWGTVRWVTRDPHLYGREPSWKEAFDNAMGLNASHIPAAVWKALPWSWCIDWFAGISDVIEANSNMVFYKPTRVCVMRRYVNQWWWEEKVYGHGYISPGYSRSSWKGREVLHVPPLQLPYVNLPFMDGFKLSILGSLAITSSAGRR